MPQLLIAAAFVAVISAIVLLTERGSPYEVGQRATTDLFATARFTVVDRAATEAAREAARRQTPNYFILNQALLESIRSKLTALLAMAKGADTEQKFIEAAAREGWELDAADYAEMKKFADPAGSKRFQDWLDQWIEYLKNIPLVETPDDPGRPKAYLRRTPDDAEKQWEYDTTELFFVSNSTYVKQLAESIKRGLPESLGKDFADMVVTQLQPDPEARGYNPIYRFDAERTQEESEEAARRVREVVVTYQPGSRLVPAGQIITPEHRKLLSLDYAAYQARVEQDAPLRRQRLLGQAGLVVVVTFITAGLGLHAYRYQPRLIDNPMRTLAYALLLGVMVVAGRLIVVRAGPLSLDSALVGLVMMAGAVLTIAYTQRFAIGAAIGLSLLMTFAAEGGIGSFFVLSTGGVAMVSLLDDIRSRSKVIVVGLIASLFAAGAVFAIGLIDRQQLYPYLVRHAVIAAASGLAAGFIVQGLLPGIERLFDIATSMTLLEWCDANKPLLKRLALEAGGTYQHSLLLGTMAEAAAEAIGANGLLARVGAYYHDIGKMNKPRYFVENQEGGISWHDQLSPTMSMMIIAAHVKDGLELARQYGLPRVLHQFIATHHGTTIVQYFHSRATEKQAREATGTHDRTVDESEFRYTGPKPTSKEAAILMLCDGCEGAVRALPEVTAGRVESAVHNILMKRLMDGQLDRCDITLRELNLIEQSLVKSLCSIHHGRIAYPGDKKSDQDTATEQRKAQ